MLKTFMASWQYGICARVVDGALVAKIDTAIEPTFVRLELTKIGSAVLAIQNRDNDHELVFVHSRAEQTPVAKFEVREAAEIARGNIMGALVTGERQRRFKGAYGATLGVAAGVLTFMLVGALVASIIGTGSISGPGMSAQTVTPADLMVPQHGAAAPAAPLPQAGEPMSADEFLNRAN